MICFFQAPSITATPVDPEWRERMAKMAFDILLKVAEQGHEEPELCAMAAAKLHTLVQTRQASDSTTGPEEYAYLIFRYWKPPKT